MNLIYSFITLQIFHIVFVTLFSYNLLWGQLILAPKEGTVVDYILLFWVIVMIAEEVREVISFKPSIINTIHLHI